MTKPRTFTPEFKAKAARAALQGQKPLAVLCCAHLRSDRIVLRWPQQLLDPAANLFAGQTPAQRDQQKIDALERLLGPLTVELAAAKSYPRCAANHGATPTPAKRRNRGLRRAPVVSRG